MLVPSRGADEGDGASKGEEEFAFEVRGDASDDFLWRGGVLDVSVGVGSAVGGLNPGLHCVTPPFGAEGGLIKEEATNAFY